MATQPALRVDRIWLTGPGRHFLLPITIPADQSITGKEITIEPEPRSFGEASHGVERPETGSDEAGTSPETTPAVDLTGAKATTILSHLRDLIAKGKARAEHFAIVFREIPGLTEAQAIEQGIRPLTQRGNPAATATNSPSSAASSRKRCLYHFCLAFSLLASAICNALAMLWKNT